MSRSLRGRLKRLEERAVSTSENGRVAPPPHFWSVVAGVVEPEDLAPAEQEQLAAFREQCERDRDEHSKQRPCGPHITDAEIYRPLNPDVNRLL